MSEVERTPAGLQIVMSGCERRTLPKSTTRVDESGQGLLRFYRTPTLRKNLKVARRRLCGPPRVKKHYRKAVCFPPLALRSHADAPRIEGRADRVKCRRGALSRQLHQPTTVRSEPPFI